MKHLKNGHQVNSFRTRPCLEISIHEPVNWIFTVLLIIGEKNKYQQIFGMTDMKSAYQTNSNLRNKTTNFIHTKDRKECV